MCMRVVLLLCFFLGIKSITSMPSFEEFLKSIDLKELEQSVEKMLEENPEFKRSIEDSIAGAPPMLQQPAPARKIEPTSTKQPAAKPSAKETPVVQKKTDPRSLFLDPLSDKDKIDPSIHVDIPKKKLESFEFHRLCLILELKRLELIIDQSRFFSIECKEKLAAHKAALDAIVVYLECIASRAFYKRIFFAKENGKIRQLVLTTLDALRKLNIKIFSNVENKKILATAIEEIDLLKTRAQKELEEPLKNLDTDLPHTKKQKEFHRGKKLSGKKLPVPQANKKLPSFRNQ